jgi:hypothetical protein
LGESVGPEAWGVSMARILTFIANFMAFLWVEGKYKIVGSEVSTSNGGDSLLFVESTQLRMRFASDRTQLLLDLQPADTSVPSEWFSIDLIRRMFLGAREVSAVLDQSYAAFLQKYLDQIEERFSSENWPQTRSQLKALKVKRAKEMFG